MSWRELFLRIFLSFERRPKPRPIATGYQDRSNERSYLTMRQFLLLPAETGHNLMMLYSLPAISRMETCTLSRDPQGSDSQNPGGRHAQYISVYRVAQGRFGSAGGNAGDGRGSKKGSSRKVAQSSRASASCLDGSETAPS